jgi:hypothetical protein
MDMDGQEHEHGLENGHGYGVLKVSWNRHFFNNSDVGSPDIGMSSDVRI